MVCEGAGVESSLTVAAAVCVMNAGSVMCVGRVTAEKFSGVR